MPSTCSTVGERLVEPAITISSREVPIVLPPGRTKVTFALTNSVRIRGFLQTKVRVFFAGPSLTPWQIGHGNEEASRTCRTQRSFTMPRVPESPPW